MIDAAKVERAKEIVGKAQTDLGKLSDGQRRDLLVDNTDWRFDEIKEIVAALSRLAVAGDERPAFDSGAATTEAIGDEALAIANEILPIIAGRSSSAVYLALGMILGSAAAKAERPDLCGLLQIISGVAHEQMARELSTATLGERGVH